MLSLLLSQPNFWYTALPVPPATAAQSTLSSSSQPDVLHDPGLRKSCDIDDLYVILWSNVKPPSAATRVQIFIAVPCVAKYIPEPK